MHISGQQPRQGVLADGGRNLARLRYGLHEEGSAPVIRGRRVVRQQGRKRAPVYEQRGLGSGKIGEGGREVVVEHKVLQPPPFGHAGAAHDQGYPYVFLVSSPFAHAQTVGPEVEAVVGGEEDVGVIELAALLKRLHELPDHVVYGQHRLQPLAVEILCQGDLIWVERRVVAYPGGLV